MFWGGFAALAIGLLIHDINREMLFQELRDERKRREMEAVSGEAEQGVDTEKSATVIPLTDIHVGITCVNCGMRLKFQQAQHNDGGALSNETLRLGHRERREKT